MNPKWPPVSVVVCAIFFALVGGSAGSCTTGTELPTEYHAPVSTLAASPSN